ncbi:RagB/SusD family nutrient uptake outer membrane protein [Chitinophaga sp. 212800010-3]|uniref:RagB/SusD family nutrient uptake outer membrane protein n=1 Tax=unclassified Chitinophaga TaxID=2619133 RepID=UPI002DE8A054|nr:Starch-binding associating with outer membrane [Chitinophaga sp. 212800010-3]
MHVCKKILFIIAGCSILTTSCEKKLEPKAFSDLADGTFYKTALDGKAAVTALYANLMEPTAWSGGYGASIQSWTVQSSMTAGELTSSWGDPRWAQLFMLNFNDAFTEISFHYSVLMRAVTRSTDNLDKIGKIAMDAQLRDRYLAEVKALRAHFSQLLFSLYGPVSIIVDPRKAVDPQYVPEARPTREWMTAQIEKDYKEAAALLPASYSTDDYGRFTRGACYMGLLKLYMQEKRWTDAVATARLIIKMETEGTYGLMDNYKDIFRAEYERNKEIIFAIPCINNSNVNSNRWLAHAAPYDYKAPDGGTPPARWGGYKMPWKMYNKFDQADKRLEILLGAYPRIWGDFYRDPVGAIPLKYGNDPAATSESQGVDIIVWRYADVLLLAAEAINETAGPNAEAHMLLNRVRHRAGLGDIQETTKDGFRNRLMDERLFELWEEGCRRDDLIRWGKFLQRAQDDGSAFARKEFALFPLPRKAITESNGAIIQNPGY